MPTPTPPPPSAPLPISPVTPAAATPTGPLLLKYTHILYILNVLLYVESSKKVLNEVVKNFSTLDESLFHVEHIIDNIKLLNSNPPVSHTTSSGVPSRITDQLTRLISFISGLPNSSELLAELQQRVEAKSTETGEDVEPSDQLILINELLEERGINIPATLDTEEEEAEEESSGPITSIDLSI